MKRGYESLLSEATLSDLQILATDSRFSTFLTNHSRGADNRGLESCASLSGVWASHPDSLRMTSYTRIGQVSLVDLI